MYFWDNFSSAVYWYKLNHHKYDKQMSISKATINVSKLLDLTDRYAIKNFNKAFKLLNQDVKSSKQNQLTIRKPHTSGGRLNWFYHIYRKRTGISPFTVVRVLGDYHMWQTKGADEIFNKQEDYPKPHITDKCKLIFTARSPSVIINREMVARCNMNDKNYHVIIKYI